MAFYYVLLHQKGQAHTEYSLSWGSHNRSASQEILRLLWKPKVHCRVHKSCHRSLSKVGSIQSTFSHRSLSRQILILSFIYAKVFRADSSLQAYQPEFSTYFWSPHACYISRLSHPTWFDYPNNIWWRVQIMGLLILQFSPAYCHFIP
jgi:hypothetical protein